MPHFIFGIIFFVSILACVTSQPNVPCPGSNCYRDSIKPYCRPGQSCPQLKMSVTACPWSFDKTPPPGCKLRCKPCNAEVCTIVCQYEIACNSGPCFLD
ncbi:hypothetical protein F5H01DRAFT_335112 [Linnemannia elongata]|nr:hypothetical protein F5H01DRAFT_335112 [Linnemannia elongata]